MIRDRYGIPHFTMCEECTKRGNCSNASIRISECTMDKTARDGRYFRFDKEARKTHRAAIAEARIRFIKSLKVTDPSQVRFSANGNLIYSPKPDKVRRFNSRSGAAIRVATKWEEWKKYCENCGARFHAVNRDRRICDKCWEEICGRLNVQYAFTMPWRHGATEEE